MRSLWAKRSVGGALVPPRRAAEASSGVDAATATTGASVLKGATWSLLGQTIPQLYLIVISVAAARYLGPSSFGRQSYIAFVEISTIALLSAGIPSTIARFVADALGRGDSEFALRLTRWSWWLESVGAVAGAGLLLIFALAGATPKSAWLFASLAVGAGILARVPTSLLTGVQLWRSQTLVGLSIGLAGMVVTVVVLAAGFGIPGMFAVEAASSVAGLVCYGWFALHAVRDLAHEVRPNAEIRRIGGDVYRFAALASINMIFTLVIWRRSEVLFLKHFSSENEIGFYSIAFAAATAPVLVLQGLIGVLMPAIATLWGAGAVDRIRTGFSRSLRLTLLITFPMTGLAIGLGPALIRLVYGGEFGAVGPALVILLAVLPFVPLVNLSNVLLGGMGDLRFVVGLNIFASIANILLDYLLIPNHGAKGAALASGLAQLTIAVPIITHATRKLGGVKWEPASLVRTALAATLSGLAAWACVFWIGSAPGLVSGILVGSCSFILLGGVLRILTPGDAVWLDRNAGRILGGSAGRVIRFWAQASTSS